MAKRSCRKGKGITGRTFIYLLFILFSFFYFQPLKTVEYKAKK